MFEGCSALKKLRLDKLTIGRYTDTEDMFKGCYSLRSEGLVIPKDVESKIIKWG